MPKEGPSSFTFVGKANDLKAYIEAQKLAQNTGQGSDLQFVSPEAQPDLTLQASSTEDGPDPAGRPAARKGLTLGEVREVFYELAGRESDTVLVADLPKALDLLGLPAVPEHLLDVMQEQVGGGEASALGLADFVAFIQSVAT